MRSFLPLLICIGCLAIMVYPAFAANETRESKSTIQICLKDHQGKCIRPKQTKQYYLGLPDDNKDGRTRRPAKQR